jgi:hypothetical protein
MAKLEGSVGRNASNQFSDVQTVQRLLNNFIQPPATKLTDDGSVGPLTIKAIEDFQRTVLKWKETDGRVDPAGATFRRLTGTGGGTSPTPAPVTSANLSGSAWWHANQASFPNSTDVDDLEAGFQAKVKNFITALEDAGADITISSTLRHKDRAYLMHYSWKLTYGMIKAADVPARAGVNIIWDHGNDAKSKAAAKQMKELFGMVHIADLASRHIDGKAIDMDITWSGTLKIKNASGTVIDIATTPRTGAGNAKLHQVGATYGVKKLVGDAPHWSHDGG